MSASVLNSQIITIFSLCIIGGLNTTTSLRCVRWLVFKDEGYALRNHINWPLLALTIFMYLLFITDLFLYMLLPLFYLRQNIFLYGAIATAVGPISLTVAIIADAILIYRCWVVYGRNWRVIIIPFISWLGLIAFGIFLRYLSVPPTTNPKPTSLPHYTRLLRVAALSCYLFSIITNIYGTTAIVYRIWCISKQSVTPGSRRSLHFTMIVIAESMFLFTATSFVALIAYFIQWGLGTWSSILAANILSAINFATYGIAFNILLIRIAQQKAKPVDMSMLCSPMPVDSTTAGSA